MRNLKALGLALVAALALSVVGASAAQAAPEFHCEVTALESSCFGHGESSNHVLSLVNGAIMRCTSTFESETTAKTSPALTLTPTYKNCKAYGIPAVVDTNGCGYNIELTATDTVAPYGTTMDVECAGSAIEFTLTAFGDCVLKIGGAQNQNLEGLEVDNLATTPKEVEATFNVGGIHYEEVGQGCPTPGTHVGATYVGTLLVKAYKDVGGVRNAAAQVGLFVA